MSTHVLTPSSSTHRFWGTNWQTSHPWFWGLNQETITVILGGPNHQTINLGFEAQTKKSSQWFWGQTTNKSPPPVLRLNWKTHTPHLLHVYNMDHTRHHSTSRSSGHWVPDLFLIIPDPAHQVSNSCLDPPCFLPCRIRHLHITRQATMFLQTK
jgi:hypothetical protein